tara:strand:- start:1653 stop:1928 length:276 start_codon:yes stop_codon:yes gene_type:complete
MKLNIESSLALDDLKGAELTDEKGKRFKLFDFYVDLCDGLGTDDMLFFEDVWVTMIPLNQKGALSKTEKIGRAWKDLKNWTIQINRGYDND